jgi:hypothetical protein
MPCRTWALKRVTGLLPASALQEDLFYAALPEKFDESGTTIGHGTHQKYGVHEMK